MLDLFQLRRCEDNLAPSPEHPGCIYGEMNKCLRPCQQVVSIEEYRGEAHRVEEFIRTDGASLRESPRRLVIGRVPRCSSKKPSNCITAWTKSPRCMRARANWRDRWIG